jgi:hypothetical protein
VIPARLPLRRQTPDAEPGATGGTGPAEEGTAEETSALTTSKAPSTTTTASIRTIEVIGREGWGASDAGPGMVEHLVERLTIHHTGVALGADHEAPSRLRAHQTFHQADRGWPDLAYHFSIDQIGNVYEGRSPEFRGDTATSYDPTGHLLVVLEGNFDIEPTFGAQLRSLAELLAWAADHYSVGTDAIKSHRDYAPGETSCPGHNVYANLTSGELIDAVTSIQNEGKTGLRYLRGSEALERVAAIESA